MDIDEIIRRLERLAGRAVHVKGEPLFVMSLDDGIALSEAVSLLKEQNWIKCSERMPEEHETIFAKFKGTDKWSNAMFEKRSDDVRVAVEFEDGTRSVLHSYTFDGKWEIEKSSPLRKKSTVTHWMPNPELPWEGR